MGNRKGWLRIGLVTVVAVVVLALTAATCFYIALDHRVRRVAITFPTGGSGQTWVIVGSDSRADLPPGRNVYGSAQLIPGQRADVVLLIHQEAGRTTVVSVPRDLLVNPSAGVVERLALTLNTGPQALVNSLCLTLGVAATHFVMVDMSAFVSVADAEGGVVVTIPYPMRDKKSGLDLPTAGTVHLNGTQLLALVRSRQAQILINGTWRSESETTGAASRTTWSGRALQLLASGAHPANPVQSARIAWALSSGTTLDTGTSLLELRSMRHASFGVVDLPVRTQPGVFPVYKDTDTTTALAAAGMGGHCQVG